MKKALISGIFIILFFLVGCGSSPAPQSTYTPNQRLLYAARDKRPNEVMTLVQNGADVNFRELGFSALLWVTLHRNFDMVKFLVENGADVNLRNGDDITVIMIAAETGQFNIVRYLVENGANVNARHNSGKTALNYAYEKGEMEIYDYLIANGAREFEPNPVAQAPVLAPQTNVYVQPSAPAQSAPAPSTPTLETGRYANNGTNITISYTSVGGSMTAYSGTTAVWYANSRISGNQLVITIYNAPGASQLVGTSLIYTITSGTSFSGSDGNWVRRGYM